MIRSLNVVMHRHRREFLIVSATSNVSLHTKKPRYMLEVGFKVGAVKGCLSCDAPLKSPVNRPAARLNPIGVPDEHRLTRSAGR